MSALSLIFLLIQVFIEKDFLSLKTDEFQKKLKLEI